MNAVMNLSLSALCLALISCSGSESGPGSDGQAQLGAELPPEPDDSMIVNPVAPVGHDPFVVQYEERYYYIYSHQGSVWINEDALLQDAVQFEGQKIWTPESNKEYSEEIWAPELFLLDGHWYVYVAADDGNNENHRMYVLRSESDSPLSSYTFVGKISDETDKWAIDGSVLEYEGTRYFIWSGWPGDENIQQNLYIAEMSSPTEITGPRVKISEPEYDWEKVGNPLVNEGPQALKNNDKTFIVYSASGSWTDFYALGLLELIGEDPMRVDSWYKHSEPVFSGTDTVFSPGHASFTKSPDGTENWIVYHTAREQGAGWDRDVNMKPFTWNTDGTPNFGEPVDKGEPIPAPSESGDN